MATARSLTAALFLLAAGTVGCKREEPESPAAKALAPFLQWCDAQGAARGSCLVSAARVTGDAAACANLKGGAPERTACLVAAATTSGHADVCRPLADRDLVLCALGVAAEHGRSSSCEVLDNVHWQGGGTSAICTAVARGDPEACISSKSGAELSALCLRFAALRLRDGEACLRLGKDVAAVQRCAAAVAVARHVPDECSRIFAATPGSAAEHRCTVDATVALGKFPPCFGDPAQCERFLFVARPCEGSGAWSDDCHIHQAVFGTGPLGCGAVQDPKRRALCARLRDAQEGFTFRAQSPDGGAPPPAAH